MPIIRRPRHLLILTSHKEFVRWRRVAEELIEVHGVVLDNWFLEAELDIATTN